MLISKLPANQLRELTFRVIIPPGAIFNFIYNYSSLVEFMGARIEGRENENGKGYDNGRIHCTKWLARSVSGQYTEDSEPSPKLREHKVHVALEPIGTFTVIVDRKQLVLKDGVNWDFDPHGKIGFMTEWGIVSMLDLELKVR